MLAVGVVIGDLLDQPGERQLSQQKLGGLLELLDLPKGFHAWFRTALGRQGRRVADCGKSVGEREERRRERTADVAFRLDDFAG